MILYLYYLTTLFIVFIFIYYYLSIYLFIHREVEKEDKKNQQLHILSNINRMIVQKLQLLHKFNFLKKFKKNIYIYI